MVKTQAPNHPGARLRDVLSQELGVTVIEAAAQLGVARVSLSRLLNCRAGVSPEMALRLERWLGTDHGGPAVSWLAMQADHDLWRARQADHATIERIKPARRPGRDRIA